jgi:hypothetical protein
VAEMAKLTLKTVTERFNKLNPYGTITKVANSKYWVYFDARDNRSEAELELERYHGSKTDKRKSYTYNVSNLSELAQKLKVDISDIAPEAYTMSKLNQEWELMLKSTDDYCEDLFGE